MQILTAAEMKATDARTIADGIPMEHLMQAAGEAVAAFCLIQYPLAARVMVLCGKGNNGGDGLVAARLLAAQGVGVRVLLVGLQAEMHGSAKEALDQLKKATSDDIVAELLEGVTAEEVAEILAEADLLVDAVVGTGFTPPLRGVATVLREAVGMVNVPVLAVDVPSGCDADSVEVTAAGAFRADAVVTFTAPKMAHVLSHLADILMVAEIGTEAEQVVSGLGLHWVGAAKAVTEVRRQVTANKGTYGHVLVVGGSRGTAGAPSMAGLAALKSGAGLVTVGVPRGISDVLGAFCVELMVRELTEDLVGSIAAENADGLEELLKGVKVLAIGPGLSTRGEAGEFARRFVAETTLPIVIDADGLNAFAGQTVLLHGAGRTMVLTPHPGEMARLLGCTLAEVEADRVGVARRFAMEHEVILVLKGWRTLIAHPDGSVGVNTSGNPALAKGGSGDILTGIIAAMLAQYPESAGEAVEAAVYLHGLAADFAVKGKDERTILATDVVGHMSDAFGYRATDEQGFTWIMGLRTAGAIGGAFGSKPQGAEGE